METIIHQSLVLNGIKRYNNVQVIEMCIDEREIQLSRYNYYWRDYLPNYSSDLFKSARNLIQCKNQENICTAVHVFDAIQNA